MVAELARDQKRAMNMVPIISIIAKNIPHAHHQTHLYTMKVYNTHHRSVAN